MGDLAIGIAFFLRHFHQFPRNGLQLVFADFRFQMNQLFNLLQKPLIDFSQILDRTERNTEFEGIVDMEQAVPAWIC